MSRFGPGFITAAGAGGNDSFTKALLHFDGTNGSTTFTDVNAAGLSNTWTAASTQVISTAGSKFGPSSLFEGSATGGISTPAQTGFNIGSGDFTVDFWWNNNSSSDTHWAALAGYGNSSINPTQWSWLIERHNSGVLYISVSDGSNVYVSSGTTNLNTGNVWRHIAVTRASGTVRGFVNGVIETTFSGGGTSPASTGPLKILAGVSNTGVQNSLLDEFRYSVGIARWTSNFTPPSSQYS